MGFNKRIISKKSILFRLKNNNINEFLNYFISDSLILSDKFSLEVYNEIKEIIKIIDSDEKEKKLKLLISNLKNYE